MQKLDVPQPEDRVWRFWLRWYPWFLVLLLAAAYAVCWEKPSKLPIRALHDCVGYYLYLPSLLLEGDLTLNSQIPHVHEGMLQPLVREGYGFNVYPVGVAILQSPFFLMGHAVAWIGGWPRTGWSAPYLHAVALGGLFYAACGLFLLRRWLERYFTPTETMVALVLVTLSTSYLHYAVAESGMSHAYSFFLFAAWLSALDSGRRCPTWRRFLLAGAIGGLIVLVRNANLPIVLAVAFLMGTDGGGRLAFWRLHWPKAMAATAAGVAVFLPQLALWRATTGHWWIDTYAVLGQGFRWTDPRVWFTWFSPQRGFFFWAPVWLLAIPGWFRLRRAVPELAAPAAAGFLIMTVLAACWCDPQFGHTFGHRVFVDIYPLLMPALAAGAAALLARRHGWAWLGIVGGALSAIGVAHFFMHQFAMVPHYDIAWADYVAGWRRFVDCFR